MTMIIATLLPPAAVLAAWGVSHLHGMYQQVLEARAESEVEWLHELRRSMTLGVSPGRITPVPSSPFAPKVQGHLGPLAQRILQEKWWV
jgi:hypothetical protein